LTNMCPWRRMRKRRTMTTTLIMCSRHKLIMWIGHKLWSVHSISASVETVI
jgi:hypothetical protein